MATVRIRYRILGKTQHIETQQMIGPMGPMPPQQVIRHNLNFISTNVEMEKKLYDAVEVGKEYFVDFTPVEESWIERQEQPPAQGVQP